MCSDDGRETPSAVAVTVGSGHTAFLMSNGALHTCGSAANGRLGTKEAAIAARAAEVSLDQLGDYSCPQVVEAFFPRSALSLNQYVTYVSCGHSHSLAITLVGILKAWGGNEHGQLGLGDTCVLLDFPCPCPSS
jgi:E3 ubiquitin-protein ligase HERC4